MRQLNHWGNVGKTELVGIPRLDSIAEPMRRALESGELSPRRRESRKRRVMIATAKTPGFTDAQIETTIRSLRDLQSYFGGQRALNEQTPEVVWRVSPQVAERLNVDNHWGDLTGGELHEQLRSVDAVITTPSTLMLEAALLGLPVCLLNYHNAPTLVPAAWEIRHGDQMAETVESLWEPPAVRLALQNEILCDALQFHQSASERMVQLIEAMTRVAANGIAAGQTLVFPEHLLEPLPQVAQVLQLGRLFPALPGLGLDSVGQLAAEWAQCRREIDHLHRELAQAKSELAEAHRIFEQIQRHPIAGPIVRIRQSFLDWLQARPKEESTESS
jgi:hypothetical protein